MRKLQRVFRATRDSPSRFHPFFVYDALITYPVDRSAIEFDLSLEKEGKRRGGGGIEGKLRSFSPRPFSLCALSSEGLFLKLVGMAWYTALAHFTSNSSPSDRQRDFKSTFILLSLLALGPKGRTHVSLTFFLITPINFPSVGTEEDGCTARRVIFIEWIIQRDYAFFFVRN